MPIKPIRSTPRPHADLNERRALPPGRPNAPKPVVKLPAKNLGDQREASRKFISRMREILKARRALVVDDDREFCNAFREYLVRKGYQVALAYSGDEAIQSYVENRPDVVFLDVRMPGKDGIETLKELKAFDSRAAVIMVSAVGDQDIVEEAKALGVFYVNKPINFRYLEHAIDTTLGLRQGILSSRG